MVDEFALELHDNALLLDQFVELGFLSAQDAAAVRKLDAQMEAMSGPENAALWTVEALDTSEWNNIRESARAILCSLK